MGRRAKNGRASRNLRVRKPSALPGGSGKTNNTCRGRGSDFPVNPFPPVILDLGRSKRCNSCSAIFAGREKGKGEPSGRKLGKTAKRGKVGETRKELMKAERRLQKRM
ncbi:hypothetical protein AKJ57_06625 [candidate division MSBL1 archaeon SCGC-AAA259A05]|uniref:Uncharacterized protein n=1 Tax=candidate division MSBL1 archaeon SCGC-AAA259A05 TaxID=1698259 RepID=A0A133U354_9EURY|nr:hypothetical protein AKJ57_06625 [candidate division MSBL1 archaeon SCGC-AAA259A05]